jgi:histidine triad (HIT) family protein
MSKDCVFCKIVSGSIPTEKVLETDNLLVFKDISPVAPVHFLIIPKLHIASLNDVTPESANILSEVFLISRELGEKIPELAGNYSLIISTGPDAGQVVLHVHFHLIGGRVLEWPPG